MSKVIIALVALNLFIGWVAGQGTEYVRTYEELNTCRKQNAEIADTAYYLDKLPVKAMKGKIK